jgi:hypothetical protein
MAADGLDGDAAQFAAATAVQGDQVAQQDEEIHRGAATFFKTIWR